MMTRKLNSQSRSIVRFDNWCLWIFLAVVLFLSVGCTPKCYEAKPTEKYVEEMFDDLDDRMDEVDATDSQRREILALSRKFVPNMERLGEQATPATQALVDEMKKEYPDRQRLITINSELLDHYMQFYEAMIPMWKQGHGVLTAKQRPTWAEKDKEPKKPFTGSWRLDGALEYFLTKIEATDHQKHVTIKFKNDLIIRSQPMQFNLEQTRIEMVDEMQKDAPDFDNMQKQFDSIRKDIDAFTIYAIDSYIAWKDEFDPGQKESINTFLNSFRPCEPGQKP
jgi:hypothetical protein